MDFCPVWIDNYIYHYRYCYGNIEVNGFYRSPQHNLLQTEQNRKPIKYSICQKNTFNDHRALQTIDHETVSQRVIFFKLNEVSVYQIQARLDQLKFLCAANSVDVQ